MRDDAARDRPLLYNAQNALQFVICVIREGVVFVNVITLLDDFWHC